MFKGNDVLGKSIITYSNGKIVDTVQDVVIDSNEGKVLGFLVDEGGLLASARVVPFDAVRFIGPDALTVDSKDAVVTTEQDPIIQKIIESHQSAKGLRVMTQQGKDLGTIVDIYFDEKHGRIEGYEVSGGLFADAYSGHSFLPAPQALKLGEDVAFVPAETAKLMEEQVGGLKEVGQKAGEKVKEFGHSAKEKGEELVATAQKKSAQFKDEAVARGHKTKSRMDEFLDKRSVDQAVGRRLKQDLRAEDGSLLAAHGQIVNHMIVQQVRRVHKEKELLAATLFESKEATKERAKNQATQEFGDAKAIIGNAWEAIKSKASDLKEQATR